MPNGYSEPEMTPARKRRGLGDPKKTREEVIDDLKRDVERSLRILDVAIFAPTEKRNAGKTLGRSIVKSGY